MFDSTQSYTDITDPTETHLELIEQLTQAGIDGVERVNNLLRWLISRVERLDPHLKPRVLADFQLYQKQVLKNFYQSKAYTQIKLLGDESGHALSLMDIYVNLVIVKEEAQRLQEQAALSESDKPSTSELNNNNKANEEDPKRLGLLRIYEDIHQAKEPIALTDLFKAAEVKGMKSDAEENNNNNNAKPSNVTTQKPLQKLLLLGRAGIGKSTLCKRLAYQWAQGQLLQEFTCVFHLELKRIAFDKKLSTLETLPALLKQYYWPYADVEEIHIKQWWEAIKSEKVLFLLDGYDEVAHLRLGLIEEVLLQQPYYLLTSRPYAAQVQRNQVDQVLENIGLTSENIQQYIDKYFQQRYVDPQAGKALKAWLAHQKVVASLCAIPIYLELLCNVWLTDSATLQAEGQITTIDLYNQLSHKLMRRLLIKLYSEEVIRGKPIEEQPETIIAKSFLGRLALEGLKQGRLLIQGSLFNASYEELQEEVSRLPERWSSDTSLIFPAHFKEAFYPSIREALQQLTKRARLVADNQNSKLPPLLESLLAAGFLKNTGLLDDLSRNDYYFIHLSFQEYFAALYLAHHIEQEYDFIANHKYDPAWQLAWTMVAGLLKEDGPRLNRFFEVLLAEPRDLYGHHEAILLAQCLEACNVSEQLNPTTRTTLLEHLKRWVNVSLQKQHRIILDALLKLPRLLQVLELESLCLSYIAHPGLAKENKKFAYRILGRWPISSANIVQVLLSGAKDADKSVRQAALEALGQLTYPSAEVIRALFSGAKDADKSVREAAREALRRLSNPSEKSIQALLSGAKDADKDVRKVALEALGRLPKPTDEIMQALFSGMKDINDWVRKAALEALVKLSTSSDEIIQALLIGAKDTEWSVRFVAFKALGQVSIPSDEMIQALLSGAKNVAMYVREAALKALVRLSTSSDKIVKVLLIGAKDADKDVRKVALEALGRLPKPTDEVIQALFNGTKDTDRDVCQVACKALSQLSNPSDEVIQDLIKGAKDEKWKVREAALEALGRLSNPSDEVIQTLLGGAEDTNVNVCQAALEALGRLPNPSDEAIQALLDGAKDTDDIVRQAAFKALGRISNPNATQALLRGAKDAEELVRERVFEALGQISNPNDDVIQTLLRGSKDAEMLVRTSAFKALRWLPKPTDEVIQALLRGSKDVDGAVRVRVFEALGQLSNPSDEVILALLDGVLNEAEDSYGSARYVASKTLDTFLATDLNLKFAPLLIKALYDNAELISRIPLPHLIKAYPSWSLHQKQARLALQYQLQQTGTVLVRTSDKTYQCVINRQVMTIECANPNQLKRDLEQIRWVPMVLKPKTPFRFFTSPSNSPRTRSTIQTPAVEKAPNFIVPSSQMK